VWQALRTELHPKGVEIVTVALDLGGAEAARPWIEKAMPEHPSLIDSAHVTDELFGFVNVPTSVWINDDGMLVRPAQPAQVRRSPRRDVEVPTEGLPERIRQTLTEVKKIRDSSARYVAGLRDWADHGAASRVALDPDEVIARSRPRPPELAQAAASFELGQHLWRIGDQDAAVRWFREAHRLDPDNWTYKRQAWTLATTAPGQPSDLLQGPTDLYEGNWLADVQAAGAENYYQPLDM
jgi:tetratricopeptide (TPR) repeat protein